jgi:hypothetical protein
MKPTFPSGTAQVISDIINTIGRDVTFYVAALSACSYSGDSLDPITNTSTNSFCPVCSGQWWIQTLSGYTTKAHITWKFADLKQWETGGWNFVGDGIIKVMYSGSIMDIIDSSEYVVVDDKQVNIEKITLLGVPALNRIILDFKERKKING